MHKYIYSKFGLLSVLFILLGISQVNRADGSVPYGWEQREMKPTETMVVIVTNTTDIVDGETSSIASLTVDPGPDGTISFREAFQAANNTPGAKAIRFTPALSGAAITFAAGGDPLNVTGGDLTIDGDIDGDGLPDITLDGHLGQGAIALISSHNIITHLTFSDYLGGPTMICCPAENCSHQTFTDNQIIDNTFLLPNAGPAVAITPGGLLNPADFPQVTDVTWQDILVQGNTIVTKSTAIYVAVAAGGSNHSQIINLAISGNHITNLSPNPLAVIDVMVADTNSLYFGIPAPIQYSDYNRIENFTIAENKIDAPTSFGIKIALANFGNGNNEMVNLNITDNTISALWGLYISPGNDGSTERGSSNNLLNGVNILGNTFTSKYLSNSGIEINAASGSPSDLGGANNQIKDLRIVGNTIEDYASSGIDVVGARGAGAMHSLVGNRIENITIQSNRISKVTDPGGGWAAISLRAGVGAADSNQEVGLQVSNNYLRGSIGIKILGGYTAGAINNQVSVSELVANVVDSSQAPILAQNDLDGASGNLVTIPAALTANDDLGRPGSFFTVTGVGFPVSSTVTITLNSILLTTTLPVDENGGFVFLLDTNQADAGFYAVRAAGNPGAVINFRLDQNAPLRPQEGTGPILIVPDETAGSEIYLPVIQR